MRVSLGEGSCGYPSLIFKRGQITLDTAQKSLSLRNCGSGGSGSAAWGAEKSPGACREGIEWPVSVHRAGRVPAATDLQADCVHRNYQGPCPGPAVSLLKEGTAVFTSCPSGWGHYIKLHSAAPEPRVGKAVREGSGNQIDHEISQCRIRVYHNLGRNYCHSTPNFVNKRESSLLKFA